MGQLVDGKWSTEWYDTNKNGGKFVRQVAGFRNWITNDGSTDYTRTSGRYHLYVSAACPWAHRTLIFRKLKQLDAHISVDFVHPEMLTEGWTFATGGIAKGDSLFGVQYLRDIYLRAKPDMTGRVTVPVLWDKKNRTIVSNESSEIIRMFNSAFDDLTGNRDDYYPLALRDEIDALNTRIYADINNGVYKAGFATTQAAYDAAVHKLFETLDWLESRLGKTRYLAGNQITEADWRLFTTLVRFDAVYVSHFKCNRNRIVDFPNLWAYARELYQWGGVAATIDFDHIIRHYHYSHDTINPYRIIPIGPALNWTKPHGRG
ncbi:MAG: glutathione S-transferase family protein [Rhodobacterales bacterium]